MLYVDLISLNIHKQHDLVLHNINKDCLYVIVASLVQWRAWILYYQFAQDCQFAIDKTSWGGMGGMQFLCISNMSQWLSQQTIYTNV